MKILILDDDIDVHLYLKQQVFSNSDEFELWDAYDREGVFNIIDIENRGQPDLCIFDIELNAKGIHIGKKMIEQNGISVAKELLKRYVNLPIFFLTNHFDNQDYFDQISKLGIPPQYFIAKYETPDKLFTIKNSIHFLQLVERAVFSDIDEIQYLLSANKKIGIPTNKGKNACLMPIEYTFFHKKEILYVKGEAGLCYIFTTESVTPYIMTTTASRIIKQLKSLYNCFVECGTRGNQNNIAINLERIKKIDLEDRKVYFDDALKTEMTLPEDLKQKLKLLKTR